MAGCQFRFPSVAPLGATGIFTCRLARTRSSPEKAERDEFVFLAFNLARAADRFEHVLFEPFRRQLTGFRCRGVVCLFRRQ